MNDQDWMGYLPISPSNGLQVGIGQHEPLTTRIRKIDLHTSLLSPSLLIQYDTDAELAVFDHLANAETRI